MGLVALWPVGSSWTRDGMGVWVSPVLLGGFLTTGSLQKPFLFSNLNIQCYKFPSKVALVASDHFDVLLAF